MDGFIDSLPRSKRAAGNHRAGRINRPANWTPDGRSKRNDLRIHYYDDTLHKQEIFAVDFAADVRLQILAFF